MAWESILDGTWIDNVKADRKEAVPIEKYSVSGKALYFSGKYLPLSAVREVRVLNSVYTPNGCCGRGIPVFKLRVDYGADKPLVLMIEREKNVERMLAALEEGNPGPPHGDVKRSSLL